MPAVDAIAPVAVEASELKLLRDQLRIVELKLTAERDEKERLRGELELRNAALDSAGSHFMMVDATLPTLPIIYANSASARDHGYERSQLLGKPISFLVLEGEHERFAKACEQLNLGQTVRLEEKGRRNDGSWFWFGCQIVPLRDVSDRITHHVIVGADITGKLEAERKKKELQEELLAQMQERERVTLELRLAQKLESVGRLAAGLAHEINTPIQYVGDSTYFLRTAFADVMRLLQAQRELLPSLPDTARAGLQQLAAIEQEIDFEFLQREVPSAFERTLEGAERVAGIVRAMKEFAHPDGQEHSPADLNRALETTLTVAHNEYKYLASVTTQYDELPPVMCNVGELNQVFLNLIVNAAHAIADAGKDVTQGCITVQTRIVDSNVEIIIGDNGCGIPPENVDKIFDPFFTTKEVGRGTGQGLAIARSIVVDKHAGDIRVDSTIGVGTRFVLVLPLAGKGSNREAR